MNKIPLLERFAAQSLVYVDTGLDDGKELVFSKEKFAELIVRECVKLCEHDSNDDEYDQYDMGQSVKAENIKTSIKQHFGVEE